MHGLNPVIYADYPDPDVVRVGDTYYMSSTSMHVFPGCQILRSYDLMHWEHCAYVYDVLGETARQRMEGDDPSKPRHIYGQGMWASSLKHDGRQFHVVFTSNDTGHSYHFTAEQAEGPWTRRPMTGFWYDPGLLFDDDGSQPGAGRVFVAHGNRTVRITELESDLSAPKAGGVDNVVVVDDNPRLGWEGSHFIKHDGWYYLFCIHWAPEEMRAMGCFRSRTPDGTFEGGKFMELDLDNRHAGVAQGGPVQLHDGSWAMLLFQDHGAVGRIPVVVPFRWVDGWPVVDSVPKALDLPSSRPGYEYAPLYTSDPLTDGWSVLWQWNHEPHPELVESDETGLRLTADRLARDCTEAVNTLTQRCFGPRFTAEVTVDGSALRPGDHAGLCALQGCFAQLGLTRTAEGFALSLLTREDGHAPYAIAPAAEPVLERARVTVSGSTVRLRADFDFDADTVQFSYLDGEWVKVGQPHQLVYRLDHFMGCRIGLFLHATQETGGSALFCDFACRVVE